jgi:hypothetical protein
VLQALLTLVSRVEGAQQFVAVEDVSALTEIAPSQPLALDIFLYAYSQSAAFTQDAAFMQSKVDNIIQSLVASFKGTDAVTLLAFLAELLRRLSPEVSCPTRISSQYSFITDHFTVPASKSSLVKDHHWLHPKPRGQ